MFRHLSRNYCIVRVMLWSFPYLLWQVFGHWSGFLVGVLMSVMLTMMLNSLFSEGRWKTVSSVSRQSLQMEAPPRDQEGAYQRGYRVESSRADPQVYLVEKLQPQYEEMQVPYPQEAMPSMEDRRNM